MECFSLLSISEQADHVITESVWCIIIIIIVAIIIVHVTSQCFTLVWIIPTVSLFFLFPLCHQS